jgi:hypothetical protein
MHNLRQTEEKMSKSEITGFYNSTKGGIDM